MIRNTFFKKTLIATAIASGVAFAGTAQAQGIITWDPDANGGGLPTAPGVGEFSGTPYDGTAVQTDRINMQAVNNDLTSSSGTCSSGQRSCWNLTFASDGSFTESFTFLVTDTELNGSVTTQFGRDRLVVNSTPAPYTGSYVSVQANLSGQLGGGHTVADLLGAANVTAAADLLDLTYDAGGTFAYTYHANLDASTAGTAMGTFNVVSGKSDTGLSDERIDLGWFTEAAADLSPVWTDENGIPFSPFNRLVNDIVQGVEIFGVTDIGGGGATVQIGSRGAIVGFSQFPIATPEPGTLALFGLGLVGLGLAARRRRGSNARA